MLNKLYITPNADVALLSEASDLVSTALAVSMWSFSLYQAKTIGDATTKNALLKFQSLVNGYQQMAAAQSPKEDEALSQSVQVAA